MKSPKFINGLTDDVQIAEAFADSFSKTCTSVNHNQNSRLQRIHHGMRVNYVGDPLLDMYKFDAELVESVTSKMKHGKAAGLDELSIEHVVNSYPVLIAILAKLFNLVMFLGHIPHGFRLSYTVPLPKEENTRNTIDSYRGISISPILSKMFEQCVLTRYSKFLSSSPNQFGFKKGSSCGHAIYSVRKVVEHYTNGGSTVNVCLLDFLKALTK